VLRASKARIIPTSGSNPDAMTQSNSDYANLAIAFRAYSIGQTVFDPPAPMQALAMFDESRLMNHD
jgi:hypothetical protein